MRKVKRWRYYCDFCKKSGGSAYHIANHERGCTANPNRECGMCGISGGVQRPIKELLAAIGWDGAESLKRLRKLTENCPACILAAIRQSGIDEPDQDPEGGLISHEGYIDFNFKEESKSFWSDQNDAREESCEHNRYLI